MTATAAAAPDLLDVQNLTVTYSRGFGRAPLTAVSDVSLSIGPAETVSIVGESGSGKSTIGSAILGLHPATSGSIRLRGEDITYAGQRRRRELSSSLQAVFQDPFSSLDPARTVGDTVSEPLLIARPRLARGEIADRVRMVLARVGIDASAVSKHPAEFSGGQRQRIAIARALVQRPEIIVCDEAVSALDVSVQAHVLNLLEELQREAKTSYLFISHNMAVVRHISHRVVVLYRGRIMEEGPAEAVCERPAHPYTRSLIASVPVPDVLAQRSRRERRQTAETRSPFAPHNGVGCPFAPRCPYAQQRCVDADPPLIETGDGRRAACIRLGEIGEDGSSADGPPTVVSVPPLVVEQAPEMTP